MRWESTAARSSSHLSNKSTIPPHQRRSATRMPSTHPYTQTSNPKTQKFARGWSGLWTMACITVWGRSMGTAIDGLALASATWGIRAFPAKIAPRHTMHRAVCATPSWYVRPELPLTRLPVGVVVDFCPKIHPCLFCLCSGCLARNSSYSILLRSFRRAEDPRKLPSSISVRCCSFSILAPHPPCYRLSTAMSRRLQRCRDVPPLQRHLLVPSAPGWGRLLRALLLLDVQLSVRRLHVRRVHVVPERLLRGSCGWRV